MTSNLNTILGAYSSTIATSTSGLFSIGRSIILESLARGFGARTYTSLLARHEPQTLHPHNFDRTAFVDRLAELTDIFTAESIGTLLDGVRLNVTVTKRAFQPAQYSDIAYDITAKLLGVAPNILTLTPSFTLPERFLASGEEPFRIDSAHTHRSSSERLVRSSDGRLLSAVFVDDQWSGALYIYSMQHQKDDRNCVGWVKASLARAILTSIGPAVYCNVFRPLDYKDAWRVSLSMSKRVRDLWSGPSFLFDLPRIAHHRFQPEKGYWADLRDDGTWVGKFVDGIWLGDLYPNGSPGLENPVSIKQVRDVMQQSMHEVLTKAGLSIMA